MISSRYEFHKLLKDYKLNGIGVEIGVGRGDFSKYLLQSTKLKKLYSVDPWNLSKSRYRQKWTQEKLDELREIATRELSVYKSRSQIIVDTSLDTSKLFRNKSIDFVYIDALHDYESVLADIQFWWPKVKAGGLLAGHDYIKRTGEQDKKAEFGVIEAVNETADKLKLKVNITKNDTFPSWYIKKPLALY